MRMGKRDGAKYSYPSWASNWGLCLMMRTGGCMAWRERRGEERRRWEGLWKGLAGRRTRADPQQIPACQENMTHTHTHTSVTTAPLWAFVCVRICGWEWTEVVKWKGDFLMWHLFALGEVCCQVLRMAGKQKNKSKREKQKVRTKNSTRTHT